MLYGEYNIVDSKLQIIAKFSLSFNKCINLTHLCCQFHQFLFTLTLQPNTSVYTTQFKVFAWSHRKAEETSPPGRLPYLQSDRFDATPGEYLFIVSDEKTHELADFI